MYEEFKGKKNKDIKKFLGVAGDPVKEQEERNNKGNRTKRQAYPYPPDFDTLTFPTEFDVQTKWPECEWEFNDIQNQGKCGR